MDAGGYVDAGGACCRAPVILLEEGMDRLSSDGTLRVEVDVRVRARQMGREIVGEEKAGEKTTFLIRKGG
ncbi:MAG: Sulfurtransferase TusA [Methanoculleus sp.]|nr:Sulfurtransferase TusA [Methanoculleus sp.]